MRIEKCYVFQWSDFSKKNIDLDVSELVSALLTDHNGFNITAYKMVKTSINIISTSNILIIQYS